MKPLAPIKPIEKLPVTYHLTMVPDPDKGGSFWSVVLTEMQGDKVLRRKVQDTVESRDQALDELRRLAYRVFYFQEGPDHMGD